MLLKLIRRIKLEIMSQIFMCRVNKIFKELDAQKAKNDAKDKS